MRTLALGVASAGVALILAGRVADSPLPDPNATVVAAHDPSLPAPADALTDATLNEVVLQYCVVCHNDQLLTGNVSLQSLDVERAAEQAQVAERAIRKLRAGMMPPP